MDVPTCAPKSVLRTNQLATLRWWGLIERKLNENERTKFSGIWRCTPLGHDFVAATASVPRVVYTYAGEVVDTSDDRLFITDEDAIKSFDYREVMGTYF